MSLEQIREKIKGRGIISLIIRISVILAILMIGVLLFGIFRQALYLKSIPAQDSRLILNENAFEGASYDSKEIASQAKYVASVTGKRYYPVECKSANRIKEQNKVYFKSQEEAESAGYTPALNC